ncbi:MAG: MFS transporter [Proteobacteria bacterium]|nr:MFS transporter [Pseudomonadota bacterium]MBS0573671.1 MFS transporter [Pseudomonadota bacterium]
MTDLTATADSDARSDARARRNVMVLVAAQAVMGSQLPMIFIVGGLAGKILAPNPCWATLPITMIVLGSMTSANPLSWVMSRRGAAFGFWLGAMGGALGAAIAAWALVHGSFGAFLLGSFLTGSYMSAQGFYRFAAADGASSSFRPKAISYVMAGGLASALIGPQLAKLTTEATAVTFLGTYLAIIGLNLVGSFLFLALDTPRPAPRAAGQPGGRSLRELLSQPMILVSMICAMVSYALMNLVMTSTPLAVVGCGYHTSNAADIVSAHVLSMYLPSFFTGHLIARFGAPRIVGTGLVILAGGGAVALSGVALENFFAALMLLGLGWNFGFIGATTMLASSYRPEEKSRIQGVNDFVVFGGVTAASLSSGTLMNCSGTSVVAGWQAVNLAMLPFLVLAGASLIWLVMRPRTA